MVTASLIVPVGDGQFRVTAGGEPTTYEVTASPAPTRTGKGTLVITLVAGGRDELVELHRQLGLLLEVTKPEDD